MPSTSSFFVAAAAVLVASSASAASIVSSSSDACGLVPSLDCLRVHRCDDRTKPIATISQYYLTNTNTGAFVKPQQHTNATICYDDKGLTIREDATDKHAFSDHTTCNSYIWQQSSAMELMIFPVKHASDVPIYYYEIDMAPTAATYGAMIKNKLGNVTNCDTCVEGELTCTGKNTFTAITDLELSAKYDTSGWSTKRFLPFSMFHELRASTGLFKFNLYRYDYPNGRTGNYELSGYSPTWSPSFHVPARFALMVLA